MFWTLVFPLLLATLFNMALRNVMTDYKFQEINIAVVNSVQYQKDTAFISALSSVSNLSGKASTNELFNVKLSTQSAADELLKNNKIDGYIVYDNGYKLVIKDSGVNQTFIKGFLDNYLQMTSTVTTIINKNPNAVNQGLFSDISSRQAYLKAISVGKSAPDTIVIYFYALLAMTSLYGSFLGMQEVSGIQANLSHQAARVNMVPVHKMKLFISSMVAATVVQLITILIVLAYLIFALDVNFGPDIGYVLLTCVAGCLTGVSFGAFISSVIKKGDGIKRAATIGTTMIGCFLAGMMDVQIKYVVTKAFPLVAYINPANLITDAFYALYYYSTYTRYFINIGLLFAFTTVFCLITYFVLRRQKYASI